jgi:hypothetical protein
MIWSNFWLSGHEGLKLGTGYLSRTIDYILGLLGEDGKRVIAFGSDLDGFSDPPDELYDARRWPILTQYLAAQYVPDGAGRARPKYTVAEIGAFLGGNMLNLIQNGWGRRSTDPKSDWIAQLGSLNNHLAKAAASELRIGGWLGDGSLQGASLRDANLQGADLAEADLRGVDLRGANLHAATLADATLEGARFDAETLLPDGNRWSPNVELEHVIG